MRPANGEDEVLRLADHTQYGFSSVVFTRDKERGLRFALGAKAGTTSIDDSNADDTPNGPVGGDWGQLTLKDTAAQEEPGSMNRPIARTARSG